MNHFSSNKQAVGTSRLTSDETKTRLIHLLSGTALTAGMMAGLFLTPSDALAACNGFLSITCTGNTTTTSGNRGKVVPITIGSGANVTGYGLGTTAIIGGATVTNNGTVNSTISGVNALDISGSSATYRGSGSVSGANNGIVLNGLSNTVNSTGGTVTGNAGDGIRATGILGAPAVSNTITLTNTNVIGANHGVNLNGATNTIYVTGGSIGATTGNGINASSSLGSALTNSITLRNTNVTGGDHGVSAMGASNVIEVTGGSVIGASGNGIVANGLNNEITLTETVVSGNSGVVANGLNSTINVTGGSVTGTNGNGIQTVSGGVLGQGAATNIIVTNADISGTQDGINALNIGLGANVSTDVTANGGTVSGGSGSGISAISAALGSGSSNSAQTVVVGDADISGGLSGVLAGSASLNGNATTTIVVSGEIVGDNGLIAVAGSVDADPSSLLNVINDPTNIGNLAGLLAGDGKATVDVTTNGEVTANNGIGIIAIGLGTDNEVSVDAKDTITARNGIGIIAGSVGSNGNVGVTVHDITAGYAGAIAFNTDGNASVTATGDIDVLNGVQNGGIAGIAAIANKGDATATLDDDGKISADGALSGVAAISIGGDATINVNGRIDPPLIGGFAGAFGNGTAEANTSGNIDADLAGVVALNVGNGRAEINSNSALESSNGAGLVGLAAVKVGDGSSSANDVFIHNSGKIGDFGISIAGLVVGDGNVMDIRNQGELNSGLAGIAGVVVGDDNIVGVSNRGSITTAGVGISGVA
ncbi:beta strand repeat-containing protein, partial [Brucella thiophenivorans]